MAARKFPGGYAHVIRRSGSEKKYSCAFIKRERKLVSWSLLNRFCLSKCMSCHLEFAAESALHVSRNNLKLAKH